jgi:hypothetical protein
MAANNEAVKGWVASIHRVAERDCLKKAYDAAQALII